MQPFALPSHGLKAEYSSSLKPRKTAHPIARTTLKWQIPLRQCRYPLSGGNGACAVGGMIMPPNGVQGQRPWHAFGSFRRETKGTRGAGRSARSLRAWELCSHKRSAEGALPPRISWAAGAPAPAPALPGERSTPFTYTPKRTKSCIPTCNCGQQKSEDFLLAFFAAKLQHAD